MVLPLRHGSDESASGWRRWRRRRRIARGSRGGERLLALCGGVCHRKVERLKMTVRLAGPVPTVPDTILLATLAWGTERVDSKYERESGNGWRAVVEERGDQPRSCNRSSADYNEDREYPIRAGGRQRASEDEPGWQTRRCKRARMGGSTGAWTYLLVLGGVGEKFFLARRRSLSISSTLRIRLSERRRRGDEGTRGTGRRGAGQSRQRRSGQGWISEACYFVHSGQRSN